MTISFFDIRPEERHVFRDVLDGHVLRFYPFSLTEERINLIEGSDVIYVRSFSIVTREILRNAPNVKLIATRSTGYDNIDVAYCRQRGIVVSNVPAYATSSVAEHTFGLLLGIVHHIVDSVNQTRKGNFAQGKLGTQITGKTLGIVGLGNIGSRVAAIAHGFGMNVISVTKHPSPLRAKKHGVVFVDLESLLKESDVVSFHVPLTDETYHMLNRNNIVSMKNGSILLNTSRGAVVETAAIVWALRHDVLGGVGLDVLEEEEQVKQRSRRLPPLVESLRKDERVFMTPHNAYHSKEAIETILRISAENIRAFLQNKPMNRVV